MKKVIILMIGILLIGIKLQAEAGDFIVEGNVGIGTVTPSAKLQIDTGTATEKGLIIKGAASQSGNHLELRKSDDTIYSLFDETGRFGFGVADPVAPIDINTSIAKAVNIVTTGRYGMAFNQTTSGPYATGLTYGMTLTGATQGTGMHFNMISSGTTAVADGMSAMGGSVQQRRALDDSEFGIITGMNFGIYMEPNTNTAYNRGNMYGINLGVGLGYSSAGTGVQTVADASGIKAGLQKNGGAGRLTMTNWASFWAPADTGIWEGSGIFTITNVAGVRIDEQTRGTNNTNLKIGTGMTGNWSIYNNSNYDNYFAGRLGIGTNTPAEKLEVAGAVKVANTASQCTSYNAGTIKFVSPDFWGCNGTGWVKLNN